MRDNVRLFGFTRVDSYDEFTPSAEVCCKTCLDDDNCEGWGYNKVQGYCRLLDNVEFELEDVNETSGFIPGRELGSTASLMETLLEIAPYSAEEKMAPMPEEEIAPMPKAVILEDQSPALVHAPIKDFCEGEQDTFYTEASNYYEMIADKEKCCIACQVDKECLSWNWEKDGKICMLNKRSGKKTQKKDSMREQTFKIEMILGFRMKDPIQYIICFFLFMVGAMVSFGVLDIEEGIVAISLIVNFQNSIAALKYLCYLCKLMAVSIQNKIGMRDYRYCFIIMTTRW